MKIFLLVMFTILLLFRMKNTTVNLNCKLYYKKLNNSIEEFGNIIETIKTNSLKEFGSLIFYNILVYISMFSLVILYVLIITLYALAANELNNTYILILSVIQIILSLYSVKRFFSKDILSTDIDDYKFQRFYNLANVIVDYMYYPVVIWMLL